MWAGGDINIHIDINMIKVIDIHIIIDMNIQNYMIYWLSFIVHSLLAIPCWLFPIGYSPCIRIEGRRSDAGKAQTGAGRWGKR